jgi:hypothetical protein
VDYLADDAATHEYEEELPSEEDQCISLTYIWQYTTDAK